jgi:uncharacterized protein YhfF
VLPKSPATDEIYSAYCTARGIAVLDYDTVSFGDSSAMADQLGHLVVSGQKRASAGLRRDFDDTSFPKVGGHVVVLDGTGKPLCIFETTEVRTGPLSSVDDAFAWDEGEGDRTRTWWLKAHTEFFTRQAISEGFVFHPDIETVFERFKVVWPV